MITFDVICNMAVEASMKPTTVANIFIKILLSSRGKLFKSECNTQYDLFNENIMFEIINFYTMYI